MKYMYRNLEYLRTLVARSKSAPIKVLTTILVSCEYIGTLP